MSQEYNYTIYYSSRDASGVMWCPDCRRVESALASVFNSNQADSPSEHLALHQAFQVNIALLTIPEAEIVYLDRPDWKSPANQYRQAPWKLTSVPTVLKFSPEGEIVARIRMMIFWMARRWRNF
jgi:hypothetical protein